MNNKKTSYKLLSLDLDGTLLSRVLRTAKKQNCLAIQEFMDCGGMPMINTGRAPWAVVKAIRQINKYGKNRVQLVSCWNGAYIRDFSDNSIYESKISHEYCSKILGIVKQTKGIKIWFYTVRGRDEKKVEIWPNNTLLRTFYPRSKLVKIKDLNDLSSYKIVIFGASKTAVANIYHELIKQNINQIVTIIHTSPRLIEITASECSKGYAIDTIAKKYNIEKNEIVALGDSFNDLCAFHHSSLSIAINPKNPNLLIHVDEIIRDRNAAIANAMHNHILKTNVQDQKFKLIFSDLDGTLIDQKTKLFSNEIKIALQQCTNHLIQIAIASGRSIYDGINIVKKFELNPKTNIYIVGNNGATIYDMFTDTYVSQSPIEDSRAKEVFNSLVEETKRLNGRLGFLIHQHKQELLFFNEQFWKPINLKKTGFEDKYDPWVEQRSTYITQYPEGMICYKFVVKFPDHETALKGNEYLKNKFSDLEVCLSSPVNVEINKKGVNKGHAVRKLAEMLNMKFSNILVLGDGQNDIPALQLCANSYAPSYASALVKKEASHVINNVTTANFASTVIYREVLKKKEQGK